MHTNSPAIVGRHPANYQCDATCGPHTAGDTAAERNDHRRFKSVPAQKNRSKSRMRDLPAWAICALRPDSGGKERSWRTTLRGSGREHLTDTCADLRVTGSDRPSSSPGLAGLRLRAQGLRPPWRATARNSDPGRWRRSAAGPITAVRLGRMRPQRNRVRLLRLGHFGRALV